MRLLTLVSCALLAAAPAAAQVRPLSVEGNVFGGIWEGDAVLDTGATFGARLQFNLNRVFGVEATYGMVPTTLTTDVADPNNVGSLISEESDQLVGQFGFNGVLHLSYGAATPYVTAGAGFVSAEDVDFASNVGLGVKYYFTDLIGARADLRGWFSQDAPSDDEFAHFEATLGLVLQFGGDTDIDDDGVSNRDDKCPTQPEDRDGHEDDDGCPDDDNDDDGIADADDKCPMKAEDQDGDKDEDGCPDLDDDNDGVANETDKCPAKAEDKDGFEDEDGCPDLDNDKDGIHDTKDKCPLKPESQNGFQDTDGCPEGDADGDGIFDAVDKCKDKPETVNGFKDADGCNDEIPGDLQAVLGIVVGVRFESQKATLRGKSADKLAEVAEVLKRYPSVTVLIAGTARRGDDVTVLSTQRAETAAAVLKEKGVDAKRIKTKGLGNVDLPADAPKDANTDRVELSIHVEAKK